MQITMTKEQILDRIKTDPVFALGFGIDNNPDGFLQVMNMQGLNASNATEAKNRLLPLISGDKQKLYNIYALVPYINKDPFGGQEDSYTGGFSEYFRANTTADQLQRAKSQVNMGGKFDIGAVLAGLGAALTGVAGYQAQTSASAPVDPSVQAAQAAAAQKAADEKVAKRKKTTIIIVVVVVVVIVVAIGCYFIFRKKPTKVVKKED